MNSEVKTINKSYIKILYVKSLPTSACKRHFRYRRDRDPKRCIEGPEADLHHAHAERHRGVARPGLQADIPDLRNQFFILKLAAAVLARTNDGILCTAENILKILVCHIVSHKFHFKVEPHNTTAEPSPSDTLIQKRHDSDCGRVFSRFSDPRNFNVAVNFERANSPKLGCTCGSGRVQMRDAALCWDLFCFSSNAETLTSLLQMR